MNINRYPNTTDRSLKAWSAADEYLLKNVKALDLKDCKILIYNDRFGYLHCNLGAFRPITVVNYKSQEKSLLMNLSNNSIEVSSEQFISPLDEIKGEVDVVLMKIPKSLDLFELFLNQISNCLAKDGIVYCSFMTRHFTKQLITLSNQYFNSVEQSLAVKKARVLTLKGKKDITKKECINQVQLNNETIFEQYYGVFSAKEIDFATQFFIEHLTIPNNTVNVLDLASGNGVLAKVISNRNSNCNLHLIDDSYLAIESSKLNVAKAHFVYNDNLLDFERDYFDLVVSNPPFHFEYETNIEISLNLFAQVYACLKKGGSFQLVSNRHLNYGVHLKKIFNNVITIAQNEKFEIYNCIK